MTAIHLIRHAKAKSRLEWTEPDEVRPLSKRGRREAEALAERLRDEPLSRVVSSPHLRCVQTLEPLSAAIGVPIETTEVLSEGRDAAGVIALLLSLAQDGPLACCTHGDVLFDVVRAIAGSGILLDGPFDMPVACTWVLQVEGDRFTGGSFVGRPNP